MLLAVAGTCSAQEAWSGIWEGTIGQAPVRVCFDGREGEHSRYYYLKYGKDILLRRSEDDPARGSYDEPGGKWQLAAEGADTLRGTWLSTNAGKKWPIQLTRTTVPLSGKGSLCEADYFFKPVAEKQKLVAGPVQSFGRHRYQMLSTRIQKPGDSDFAPEAVVLLGFGDKGAAINQLLQQRLRQRLARSLDSRMGGLAESTETVAWLSDRWLSLRETEWPNGYGASGISMRFETWDLAAGRRFDLWRWFNARAGAWHEEAGNDGVEQVFTTSGALQKALGPFDNNGGDPDCKDPGKSWREPRLASGGIEFGAGQVGPCLESKVVSFETLQPFLNEEGQRQVAALQREAASVAAAQRH